MAVPQKKRINIGLPIGVYSKLADRAAMIGRSISEEAASSIELAVLHPDRIQGVSIPAQSDLTIDCYRRLIRKLFEGQTPDREDIWCIAADLGIDSSELLEIMEGIDATAI